MGVRPWRAEAMVPCSYQSILVRKISDVPLTRNVREKREEGTLTSIYCTPTSLFVVTNTAHTSGFSPFLLVPNGHLSIVPPLCALSACSTHFCTIAWYVAASDDRCLE